MNANAADRVQIAHIEGIGGIPCSGFLRRYRIGTIVGFCSQFPRAEIIPDDDQIDIPRISRTFAIRLDLVFGAGNHGPSRAGQAKGILVGSVRDLAGKHLFRRVGHQRDARPFVRALPLVGHEDGSVYLAVGDRCKGPLGLVRSAIPWIIHLDPVAGVGRIVRHVREDRYAGTAVVGLDRKGPRAHRPRPAPQIAAIESVQRSAVGIGEGIHDLPGGEGRGRGGRRRAGGIIVFAVRVEGVVVRRARSHHVFERCPVRFGNHNAAAARVARVVLLPLGRRRRGAAGLVDDHYVIRRVLRPGQPDQRLTVRRGRLRRRIGQDGHAARGRGGRPVVQEGVRTVVGIDRHVVGRPGEQARHRHGSVLARRRVNRVVAGAKLAAGTKGRAGRVVRPINRIRVHRRVGLDQDDRAVRGTGVGPNDGGAAAAGRQERGQRRAGAGLRWTGRGVGAARRATGIIVVGRVRRRAVVGERVDHIIVGGAGGGAVTVGHRSGPRRRCDINHGAVAEGTALRIGGTIRRNTRRRGAGLAHDDKAAFAGGGAPLQLDLGVRKRRRGQRAVGRRLRR